MSDAQTAWPVVVLDTNIVLDLWLYEDPATPLLRAAIENKQVHWLATSEMREELRRVLHYPHIAARLQWGQQSADIFMAKFDTHAQMKNIATRAPYVCKDADDQKFIDLAVAHSALLLSKDKQVLRMTNRLAKLGVIVKKVFV